MAEYKGFSLRIVVLFFPFLAFRQLHVPLTSSYEHERLQFLLTFISALNFLSYMIEIKTHTHENNKTTTTTTTTATTTTQTNKQTNKQKQHKKTNNNNKYHQKKQPKKKIQKQQQQQKTTTTK